MKLMCSLCASFLLAFVLITVLPVSGEESIYSDIVRLHVIAASDSEEDQNLKLLVRDEILNFVSQIIDNVKSREEAEQIIGDNLNEINDIAEAVIKENGFDYPVESIIGLEEYPERVYDNFTLPSGEYVSLIVKIGKAEGKNWWCILFPPLCTTAASKQEEAFISAGFTGEQYKVITNKETGKYRVKFKLLEIIEEIFS